MNKENNGGKENKRLLILGASGRTGKLILKEALTNNFRVNVLVRDAKGLPSDSQIAVFHGLPTDIVLLEKALVGCDCVINCLNISRQNDFPWSKIRSPKDLISESVSNLIRLSKKYPIHHLISISAWGVGETQVDIPFWFKLMIKYSNIKYPYLDHERQESLLKQSHLNWTIIRPVGLVNSSKTKELIVSDHNLPKPNLLVSRENLAKFIIKISGLSSFFFKAVTVSQ